MATNYTATPFAGLPIGQVTSENFTQFSVTVPVAGYALNDVVFLTPIPNGCTLFDWAIDLIQLDTNVAPALTIDVGDNLTAGTGGVNANGYMALSTMGRSATAGLNTIRPLQNQVGSVVGKLPFTYSITNANIPAAGNAFGGAATGAPAGIWLVMKIHAAPATSVTSGTYKGWMKYTYENSTASQTNPLL